MITKAQCFKTVEGTEFHKAIKTALYAQRNWDDMIVKVGEYLGEPIQSLGISYDRIYIPIGELKKKENVAMFTKHEGMLKKKGKGVAELKEKYQEFMKELGIEPFRETREIFFIYGLTKFRGQKQENFIGDNDQIFFKADYDMIGQLKGQQEGMLEEITEVEYQETYIEVLKKREARKAEREQQATS